MVIKRSGGQACRWRAVNCEIHLWSSGKNADCIFGDRSASSMSKWRPAWTLTPEMIPFRTKSVTLSMLINLLTSTMSCRTTQVKIASTDLWPQEIFTFSEMLALVESESSFGAYVCHRRPGGSRATSDLVSPRLALVVHSWRQRWNAERRRCSVCSSTATSRKHGHTKVVSISFVSTNFQAKNCPHDPWLEINLKRKRVFSCELKVILSVCACVFFPFFQIFKSWAKGEK